MAIINKEEVDRVHNLRCTFSKTYNEIIQAAIEKYGRENTEADFSQIFSDEMVAEKIQICDTIANQLGYLNWTNKFNQVVVGTITAEEAKKNNKKA